MGIGFPIIFLLIVPTVQLLLTYLYHRHGHPWSRIFREEMGVKSPKKSHDQESRTLEDDSKDEKSLEDEQDLDVASDEGADDDNGAADKLENPNDEADPDAKDDNADLEVEHGEKEK